MIFLVFLFCSLFFFSVSPLVLSSFCSFSVLFFTWSYPSSDVSFFFFDGVCVCITILTIIILSCILLYILYYIFNKEKIIQKKLPSQFRERNFSVLFFCIYHLGNRQPWHIFYYILFIVFIAKLNQESSLPYWSLIFEDF